MPRLRQVSRADADASVVPMYDFLFGDRDPVAGFGLYRSPNRKLDPLLRELGQTRTGWARQSQFVFSQHCKSCRGLGMPEDKIAAIPHWQVAECFDEVERAVLAYTDCLVLEGGRVPDGLFSTLQRHLSDEEIFELTYITCMYEMHATIGRALKLEFDDVAERITELPAPDGFDAARFAGVRRR